MRTLTHAADASTKSPSADRTRGTARRTIQRLAINTPGDVYEQEADRVAHAVMRMPASRPARACPCGGGCPTCAAEHRDHHEAFRLHRAVRLRQGHGGQGSQPRAAPPLVDNVLAQPGQPLDGSTRHFFEERFGSDFSGVRVHTGLDAAESAQAIDAQAYTARDHIVFGDPGLSPGSGRARSLLAHELTHVVQQGGARDLADGHEPLARAPHDRLQRQPQARPTSEDVWGFTVTRGMCGCRAGIREDIDWAKTAAATYAACDVPANTNSTAVEACFEAAHPGSTVEATTDSSGAITVPPPSNDPCQQIHDRGTLVHETMHSRYTEALARSRGTAFFREWVRLAGTANRLETLRATFPAEVASFEARFHNGHEWAQDEINSFRWERRFLEAATAALNRIC